jgi:hypothetical protein
MSTSDPDPWGRPPDDVWAPPAAGQQPGSQWPQPPPTAGWAVAPPPPTGGNARTGPLALQPMGIGELLDAAIKLYRANFKPIALVAFLIYAPFQIVFALIARGQNNGRGLVDIFNDPSVAQQGNDPFANLGSNILTSLTPLIDLLFLGPLLAGTIAAAVAATYLGGQLTAGEAIRRGLGGWRWLTLPIASVMVHLTELAGVVGCCIGAYFVMALWVVVSPAMAVEEIGPFQAMARSFNLCTSRYWPVLGVALLSGLIVSTLGFIVGGVPQLAAALIGYKWGFPLLALGGIATAVLVEPLTAIVATLLYFDLRIRREGFDLQMMAAGAAPLPGPA